MSSLDRSRRFQWLIVCLIAIFGGVLTWITGHRGVYLLDQSMVFDGGWRVFNGERIYLDFGAPFGPLTFWIQGAFFAMMGVTWSAMVAPAVLFNVLAVPVAWALFDKLFARQSVLAPWIGASLVGLFLYPPFGTQWFEVNGLFFMLLSLMLLVVGEEVGRQRILLDSLAGLSLFCAFLSKQNVPMFYAIPFLFVAFVFRRPGRGRSLGLAAMAAIAAAGVLFLIWLWGTGRFELAKYYLFDLPRSIAGGRFKYENVFPLSLSRSVAISASAAVWALAALSARWGANSQVRLPQLGLLNLLFVLSWILITSTTMNEGLTMAICLSLIVASVFGILEVIARNPGPLMPSSLALKPTLPVLLVILLGVSATALMSYRAMPRLLTRESQGFTTKTAFDTQLKIPGMQNVWWGTPTDAIDVTTEKLIALNPHDLEATYDFLHRSPGNFLVLGDAICLYGLLQRPSSSFLLYFMADHSYVRKESAWVDQLTLERFQKLNLRWIVRETALSMPWEKDHLRFLPKSRNWVEANFQPHAQFGSYQILVRR